MLVTLLCSCGKALEVDEAVAEQTARCPACGGSMFPAPLLEEADAPIVEAEPQQSRRDAATKPHRKKKKKKKIREVDPDVPVTEQEKRDAEADRQAARRNAVLRVVLGFAYITLGGIITAAMVYALMQYHQDLLNRIDYALAVLFFLGVGLAALGKGLFGLLFGHFVGE